MIRYLIGDATDPVGGGKRLLIHISNDLGGWGAGFVLAISKRWPEPEKHYRLQGRKGLKLGDVQFVPVSPTLTVCNMVAQAGYGSGNRAQHRGSEPDDSPPIRYDALEQCLSKVAIKARKFGSSVHAPRIGTGLAGGKWSRIEPLLESCLDGLEVFIYDLTPLDRLNAKLNA